MKIIRMLLIGLLISLISACHTRAPKDGNAIDVMQSELKQAVYDNQHLAKPRHVPPSVSAALMPDMPTRLPTSEKPEHQKFDIAVTDIPARDFFMGLVQGTDINMIVSPEVTGAVSLKMKNVTILDVLKTVQSIYGYDYRRTRVGYEVMPNSLASKIFNVNYLDVSRKGRSQTELSSGQLTERVSSTGVGPGGAASSLATTATLGQQGLSGSSVETRSELNFWQSIRATLDAIVGNADGRSVVVNPQAGIVIVRAYPKELRQIERYLDRVQKSMNRQVILEAKILEVRLKDQYQAGIDWTIYGARLNALSTFPGTTITAEGFVDAFQALIKWRPNDFETTIRALETQGNVQVLSSPRVSTLNNQKAVIKVGNDEFFVTSVASSLTETATTATPTQDVQLTPFFSGITLDVTPQIDATGGVTLHVHPAVSQVIDQTKRINLGVAGQLELPLAQSTIRESDTIVHARNGQVIVIGGLMKNETEEEIAQLPFVGEVPYFGALFRNTKQTMRKSELVILLKPTVVGPRTWANAVQDEKLRIDRMDEGLHFGGRPDIFGTEGEKPMVLGPKVWQPKKVVRK